MERAIFKMVWPAHWSKRRASQKAVTQPALARGAMAGFMYVMICEIAKRRGDAVTGKNLKRMLGALQDDISGACKLPFLEGRAFFGGFVRALNYNCTRGAPAPTTALPIYLALMRDWQTASHLLTVTALHAWLCTQLHPNVVGSVKRVEKLVQRVGLKLSSRGRPSGARKSDTH